MPAMHGRRDVSLETLSWIPVIVFAYVLGWNRGYTRAIKKCTRDLRNWKI